VEVGERVDVWVVVDPSLVAADGEPTRRLAAGAVVVGVSERTVTVAVEPDEVADVAAAAAVAATALSGRP